MSAANHNLNRLLDKPGDIIDVDPNEAELLINLIETLFQDWYVNREERKKRLEAIVGIGSIKADAKKGNNS